MRKSSAHNKISIAKSKGNIRGLGAFSHGGKAYFYFQGASDSSFQFHAAVSNDGFSFERQERDCFIEKGEVTKEDIALCHTFSISEQASGQFLLMYVKTKEGKSVVEKAWSKDLLSFSHEGDMIGLDQKGVIVSDYSYKRYLIAYSSDKAVHAYFSKDLIHWEKNEKELLFPRNDYFDSGAIEIVCIINSEKGILLIYHSKVEDVAYVGMALFDRENPTYLLWRSSEPLWIPPQEWRGRETYPIGVVLHEGNIIAYFQVEDEVYAVSYALYKISDGHTSKDISLKLKRVAHNPIISPNEKNSWESFNTFNPAAIYDDGKVHLLYRAQGYDYVSMLGYASSRDGVHVDERLDQPVYVPSQSFENNDLTKPFQVAQQYISGGGYGGCEDPRITRIDDRFYLTYVAFDGMSPPCIALTSISVDNFLNKRFLWERPVIISPPGIVDKSAVIFPEKIHGKYVIMHRIYPDILIDYVDDLSFDGTTFLKGEHKISPRFDKWDSRKIGAGAPPLKTKYGWLLIYQSVGEQDSGRYKIGAMLLDLKDPAKVLYRSQSPILEPDASYENDGFKAGVIYPCGAVIIDKTLFVYYGGADSYVCVATANLDEFLDELKYSQVARLTTPIVEKLF